VVVATTDRSVDDPIAAFAAEEGVAVFRGASEDVAKRCVDCADRFGFDVVSRICGDSPFIDPDLMSAMIDERERRSVDIATNVMPRSCPSGNAVEIVTAGAMHRVLDSTDDPDDREHVTRYIYQHPDEFTIWGHAVSPETFAGVRIVVDTPQDLEQVRWLVAQLSVPPAAADYETIANLSRHWWSTNG
jgi:spore coat polysaccharide biosynthesis protein SpsF